MTDSDVTPSFMCQRKLYIPSNITGTITERLSGVFTKGWFQRFLIKGSKIVYWSANHFSVFCFPWARVWKNIHCLVIYHTNLFYVKFLQKCHQLTIFLFEFFYNSVHLQQLHFFLLWAEINPIFWKNAKFVGLLKIIQ